MNWRPLQATLVGAAGGGIAIFGRSILGDDTLTLTATIGFLACFFGGCAALGLVRARTRVRRKVFALGFGVSSIVFCGAIAAHSGEIWRNFLGMVCMSAMPAGIAWGALGRRHGPTTKTGSHRTSSSSPPPGR